MTIAHEAAELTEKLLTANAIARLTRPEAVCVWCADTIGARLTRPEAVCVWCADPIDPDTWDGWEVFANGDVAGPCCNTCSAPAKS